MYKRNGVSLVDHTDSVVIEGSRKTENIFLISSPKVVDEFLQEHSRNIPMDDMKIKLIVVPDIVASSIYVEKMREVIDVHSKKLLEENYKFVFASWKLKKANGMSVVLLGTNGSKKLLDFEYLLEKNTQKEVVDFDSINEIYGNNKFDIFESV